jgi:predicted DNA-binding transcriptional regulator AlpA
MEKWLLNAKDIMQVLGVGRATAYNILNIADAPLVVIKGCKYVLADEFREWIRNKVKNKEVIL